MPVNTVFSIHREGSSLKNKVEVVVIKLKDLIQCAYNLNNKSSGKKSELQAGLVVLEGMVDEINKVYILEPTITPNMR